MTDENHQADSDQHEAPDQGGDSSQYAAALNSVRHAIRQFEGCSDAEKEALERELDQLRTMAEKLQEGRVEIAVVGEISTGKSALINALVGDIVTQVNVRGGWTRDIWKLDWEAAGYCIPGIDDSEVVLIDTPGLNEVEGADRGLLAYEAAVRADLLLFVVDSDLNDAEFAALSELSAIHKPMLLVLNKADLYSPAELAALLEQLRGPRVAALVPPENVVVTSADPRPVEFLIEGSDGAQRREWRKPEVRIAELRQRILEVLDEEGAALVALNAAMYAADKSDRMAALRVAMREDQAAKTIWKYTVVKSLAVALNPMPVIDVVGGTAVDVTMVATLARVYGIPMTVAGARELVTSILKAAGWIMLGEAAVSYASSVFKGLTVGYGTVLTYLPQGAAAGYGSYIVGQAARHYFRHGASWGDEAPKTVVTQILENTDKQWVIQRLKEEIKQRIALNPYAGDAN